MNKYYKYNVRHLVGCLLEVLHVVSQHQVTQGQEVAVVLARGG